ncbi:hypothetical protein [Chromobacterium sphagni]|uniref:Major facilitator superfamily (MFS) profile domain-containing protein n=1 Tax=Chromobacterium sphagni TaxID=1903179 RepID=A0ABX3CBY0_9NEIS|nr:hypothetical protein [Chromobacterium sphagni]OHX19807.1 hypothetical protein BI344_16570 [Chromobacterium sphagni]
MSAAAVNAPHRGMVTISIMLATIMQALDTTIANVALPHMQGSLQSSQDQISWVFVLYRRRGHRHPADRLAVRAMGAALVAYIDNFKMMMWLSLAVLPLLLLITRPAASAH